MKIFSNGRETVCFEQGENQAGHRHCKGVSFADFLFVQYILHIT